MDQSSIRSRSDQVVRSVEVRVPASTANFGSGFDCSGLALQLYLTVRATVRENGNAAKNDHSDGFVDVEAVHGPDSLIHRAMRFVAQREGFELPNVHMLMRNEIPLGSGLGSSGAAIVAGLRLALALTGNELSTDKLLRYATALEGHADNVAAALLGGWVVHCISDDGSIYVVKKEWPRDLKIIIVTPHFELNTKWARSILPATVDLRSAVFNLQRLALFHAALDSGKYDLIWEGMQDRLHQPHRRELVPGLAQALSLSHRDGLLGLALSGAGPSVLALTDNHVNGIGEMISRCFREHSIKTTTRYLEVDTGGAQCRSTRAT